MNLQQIKEKLFNMAENNKDWLEQIKQQGHCIDCGVIVGKDSKRCVMHSTIRRFYPKVLVLTLVLLNIAFVASGPTPITLSWNPQPSVDVFKIYSNVDINVPLTNWNLLTTVSGTNSSCTISILPVRQFFYITASNFWGESGPSNVTNTPSAAQNITNLQISR